MNEVASELRQMLVELRPTLVEHLGLSASLRAVGRHAEERFPNLAVDVRGRAGDTCAPPCRLALFRIAQEAVSNVGRHAEASQVEMTLADDRGGVRLSIQDDGHGFSVPERMVTLARTRHFGLVGMQEQAEAVGGTFQITSAQGHGTRVEAWVPDRAPDLDA